MSVYIQSARWSRNDFVSILTLSTKPQPLCEAERRSDMKNLTSDEAISHFRDAGALLEGHFRLTSGRHSRIFLQKALVFSDPRRTEILCSALASKIEGVFGKVDVVVSPAVGAIIPGYETARALGAKAVFVEREGGTFALRRGFTIPCDARVVMVEDIVTTGLSSRECLAALAELSIHPVGAACLIDRSGGRADPGIPLVTLATMDIPTFAPDELPPDLAGTPAIKPGSRGLA